VSTVPAGNFARCCIVWGKTVGTAAVMTKLTALTAVTSVEKSHFQLLRLQCLVFQQQRLYPLLLQLSVISVDSDFFHKVAITLTKKNADCFTTVINIFMVN
jgi:hypothetical protein